MTETRFVNEKGRAYMVHLYVTWKIHYPAVKLIWLSQPHDKLFSGPVLFDLPDDSLHFKQAVFIFGHFLANFLCHVSVFSVAHRFVVSYFVFEGFWDAFCCRRRSTLGLRRFSLALVDFRVPRDLFVVIALWVSCCVSSSRGHKS